MSDTKNKDKSSPELNPITWLKYLSLFLLGLVIFTIIYSDSTVDLSYPQFKELVQRTIDVEASSERDSKVADDRDSGNSPRVKSTSQETARGVLLVNPPKTGKSFREFSLPHDILIDDQYIRGKVMYREVGSGMTPPKADRREVNFRVANDGNTESNQLIRQMMTDAKIEWQNNPGPGLLTQYLPFILMMLLPILLIGLLLRKMGGIGSPMQFGRSRGKLYAQEDIAVTFDDVAGIDEAVEEVREVVDFLQNPDKYQKLGGRIPKGVLLVGPPGTGKTLLAKAIAGEAGVPFFSLSGSDFVEMFVGVGAARVRDMFQQATAKAPCIIFIDELDALGKSRAGNVPGSHDEREQTLNALLVEMDGFDANNGVIVMAATNRPETLDSALLRPGRFDRNVLVDRPDKTGREEILKVHVKNVKLAADVDLKQIAAISPGFVGADLANLVNEAALLAARKGKSAVGQEEFNDSVERVTAGLEKKKRLMTEPEKRRVAYHEAGHALVAYSLPDTDPVHKVSIIPRGVAALGYTMQRPEDDRYLMTQLEIEAQLQVLLAGTITEELVFRDISTGAQNDLERATALARGMVMEYGMSRLGRVNYRESNRSPFLMSAVGESYGREYSEQTAREIDQEVKRIIDETVVRTRSILTERRQALEALAQRLIEVEVVDSVDLKRIMDDSLVGPRVVPGTVQANRVAADTAPASTNEVTPPIAQEG
jgi:cell division protease FtsH